jgi:hypothetical protein
MSQLDQVDGWEMEHTGEVLVFEFGPDMELEAFGEDAWEAYTEMLSRERVCAIVTVVEVEDPFDAATFDVWERSGHLAAERGVERWAVVGDRLKRMSTRSKLDVEGLEVEGFDDRAEALAWARPD